jgi:hypothetical protein
MWLTASMTDKGGPVDQVKAWASPSKGLRVHAEVSFADEQKATEIYGKANLGLAAMSMSDEVGELASAVSLKSSGRVMTADVELTDEQMKTVVAKGKAHHHARHGHDGSHVSIEVDAD